MNVMRAVKATLDLARAHDFDPRTIDTPSINWDHLLNMESTMIMEEEFMSYGKKCRWLGWMQACVVAANVGLTLEHMKKINIEANNLIPRDEHEAALKKCLRDNTPSNLIAALDAAEQKGIERAAVIADEFRHGNPSPTVYGAIARAIRADKGDQ